MYLVYKLKALGGLRQRKTQNHPSLSSQKVFLGDIENIRELLTVGKIYPIGDIRKTVTGTYIYLAPITKDLYVRYHLLV